MQWSRLVLRQFLAVAANHAEGTFFTLCCDHRVVFARMPHASCKPLVRFLPSPDKLL
jgi:hypothetical protein